MPSIPASAIVNILPSVIEAGGSALELVGLILTDSDQVPVGSVESFANAADVAAYFGPLTDEAQLALIYFDGFDGATATPARLLFSQYPVVAVAAYLRGGTTQLTLDELKAIAAGTMTISIDGRSVTSASINLSGATSFSNAATLIQTALADQDASFTGAIAGATLTASSVTGIIAIGQEVTGPGVTVGTVITALGSGTGGAGTYTVSPSQTVASASLKSGVTTVTYDSVLGAFVIHGGTPGATGAIGFAVGAIATALGLTASRGAVLSQGAAAATPETAMPAIVAQTQDFASFMTSFLPAESTMLAFAEWTAGTNDGYIYAMWDTAIAATTSNDTTSVGYKIRQNGYSGTVPIWDATNLASAAAFLMGAVASVDFARTNGRTTFKFRSGNLLPGVTNGTIASHLEANGYNFYGAYASRANDFQFFSPGQISGDFQWLDSYANQIWLNDALQVSLINLLTSLGSIPYNQEGYALIQTAMTDPVNQAISFGAIRSGVTLSASQASEVNTAAGTIVSDTIQQVGYYIQVRDPGAVVRAARGTPVVYLWYTDGQSVQTIVVSSVLIK